MRDSVELQAELHCALGTFEEATNGRYDSGVPSNGMKPGIRNFFTVTFVQTLVEGLSRGLQLDQIQLLVIDGLQHRVPQALAGLFSCSTDVETIGRGASGRYQHLGTPAQAAEVVKQGPVTQHVTCVVSVSPQQSANDMLVRLLRYCRTLHSSLVSFAAGRHYAIPCDSPLRNSLVSILQDSST